jgi:tryptophan-rich sensory protein
MGLASWMIWRSRASKTDTNGALTLYSIQLALNLIWSPLFFGLRSPGLALIDIAALLAAIVATIWRFSSINSVAALLLVPYLIWVTFATALNATIWRLNR